MKVNKFQQKFNENDRVTFKGRIATVYQDEPTKVSISVESGELGKVGGEYIVPTSVLDKETFDKKDVFFVSAFQMAEMVEDILRDIIWTKHYKVTQSGLSQTDFEELVKNCRRRLKGLNK